MWSWSKSARFRGEATTRAVLTISSLGRITFWNLELYAFHHLVIPKMLSRTTNSNDKDSTGYQPELEFYLQEQGVSKEAVPETETETNCRVSWAVFCFRSLAKTPK